MTKKMYCDADCAESYHEDRRAGLIYPPFGFTKDQLPKRMQAEFIPLPYNSDLMLISWDKACTILHICKYCRTQLEKV